MVKAKKKSRKKSSADAQEFREVEKLVLEIRESNEKFKLDKKNRFYKTFRQQREEFNAQFDSTTQAIVRKAFLSKYDFSKFIDLDNLIVNLTCSEIKFLKENNQSFKYKITELSNNLFYTNRLQYFLEKKPTSFDTDDLVEFKQVVAKVFFK